jgi:hypothetical protein
LHRLGVRAYNVAMKTVYALIAAGITFAVVAIREIDYRQAHPYAHGVSGELIALGVAGAVAAFAVAAYVYRSDEARRTSERDLWTQIRTLREEIATLTGDEADEFLAQD